MNNAAGLRQFRAVASNFTYEYDRRRMRTLIAASLGYLAGSFPTADIVTRYANRSNGGKALDLRAAGTGNPGSLNAAKVLGWKWGAIILAGDVIKGALASLAGRAIAGDAGTYAAGSGAVIGHCAPVWNGFRGGKGVATSAGTSLVCFPAYMPIDVSLAAGTLALSGGKAGMATYVASAIFVTAAFYWWLGGRGNIWGPRPTIGLPLYALSTSGIIIYRFLTAPPAFSPSRRVADAQTESREQTTAVAS
jgi:acyl phosphate:glycerol-3-phosphate acyltransferase